MYEAFLSQAPWKWLFYDILKDNIFLFFPYLQCVVQVLVQSKGLGEKKKSPLSHWKHCSWNVSSVIQLCDFVTSHFITMSHIFAYVHSRSKANYTVENMTESRNDCELCCLRCVCELFFFFFQLIQLIVNGVFSSVVPKVGGVPPRGGAGVITGEVQLG